MGVAQVASMKREVAVLGFVVIAITEMVCQKVQHAKIGLAVLLHMVVVVLDQPGELPQFVLDGAQEHHQAT